MTRAPRSASCRVEKGAATACSKLMTVIPCRGGVKVIDSCPFRSRVADVGCSLKADLRRQRRSDALRPDGHPDRGSVRSARAHDPRWHECPPHYPGLEAADRPARALYPPTPPPPPPRA